MRRVFHADYVGDLEPLDYERAQLSQIGAELVVARFADQDELIRRAEGAEVVWLEWVPPVDEYEHAHERRSAAQIVARELAPRL